MSLPVDGPPLYHPDEPRGQELAYHTHASDLLGLQTLHRPSGRYAPLGTPQRGDLLDPKVLDTTGSGRTAKCYGPGSVDARAGYFSITLSPLRGGGSLEVDDSSPRTATGSSYRRLHVVSPAVLRPFRRPDSGTGVDIRRGSLPTRGRRHTFLATTAQVRHPSCPRPSHDPRKQKLRRRTRVHDMAECILTHLYSPCRHGSLHHGILRSLSGPGCVQ
ncbi:hypothetical protein C8T65DRAFT_661066 [Cerioporus squamosus]|nr:hypothetical protein C8T65DRAFT_661066 [Cerioporus squamosus]